MTRARPDVSRGPYDRLMTPAASRATLSPARQEDADRVADIWHLGWQDGHRGLVPVALAEARTEDSFSARAAERVADTTVATVDGVVVGFVMVVDDEVEQVYVTSEARGTGVARELIVEAERQVRANGHETAWLAVVPGNARARAFYARAGWVDEGPFDYQASDDGRSIGVPCHRYVKRVANDDR